MAKRSEIIKGNCPACGCGIIADLDDNSITAIGDFAKKPSNPERAEEDQQPDSGSDSGERTEEDRETSTGEDPAYEKEEEISTVDDPTDAEDPAETKGLGDW